MDESIKVARGPIFLVGATGTGKSAVALDLARRLGGAILAMDAMQVYRGADIGTSKPTRAEQEGIPHGGLDLVDFGAHFDVALYLQHAAAFLQEQAEARRPVIIVGGTGLYFRALTRGLCEAPQGSDELRAELNALSVEALRERLRAIDPVMLAQVDASNPRRLIRAIEVMEATGKSLRVWQAKTPEPLVRDFQAFWIGREKAELQARLEARVGAMFEAGWVEEVRGLVQQYGMKAVLAFAGIGYREIAEAGMGNGVAPTSACPNGVWERGDKVPITSPALKNDILVTTRQYAKRQLTWFAREPNLRQVMLSGSQPFPADALLLP